MYILHYIPDVNNRYNYNKINDYRECKAKGYLTCMGFSRAAEAGLLYIMLMDPEWRIDLCKYSASMAYTLLSTQIYESFMHREKDLWCSIAAINIATCRY